MVAAVKRVARAFGVALACWIVAIPAAAFTTSLTVSGTTYNVQFTAGSFNSVNGNPATSLTTTPWYNPSFDHLAFALAEVLRDNDAPGGAVVPDTSGAYIFVSSVNPITFRGRGYSGTTAGFLPGTIWLNPPGLSLDVADIAGAPLYFASVAPAPVPEIDGNALFKALFILFTLYVWIQVRRNRRARA